MERKNQNMMQKDFRNWSELRIFLSYFRPHRKLFYLDMVSALAIAVIDLAFPAVSRWCMYTPESIVTTFPFAKTSIPTPPVAHLRAMASLPIVAHNAA